MAAQEGLTVKKSENISEWFTQVITKADLIEYTQVSGCMIFKPYVYAIWEKVVAFLDTEFKKTGVQNAYFPLLIPEELLNKEASHIDGFAPEVAWVTHGGNTELGERLAIRPTSETIMYDAYSKWIRSHRDLPLRLNQWSNTVRWEFKHPTPFLRNREFLWQEGHSAFATEQEAIDEAHLIHDIYLKCYEELFATTALVGRKSDKEVFAGAVFSLSLETVSDDGKALQACTSHHLGQKFAQAFDVTFTDENEEVQHVWQNSWGFSTRSIGALILNHGDDKGLVLPPSIAPILAVVVPIVFSKKPEQAAQVLEAARTLAEENGYRLDDRDGYSPGYKFNEWELKGVPFRIELGPRDLEKNVATIVRRDLGIKQQVPLSDVAAYIKEQSCQMQKDMLDKERARLAEKIVDVTSLEELKQVIEENKIGRAPWCGSEESEQNIKEVTGAKSLNGTFSEGQTCFESRKPAIGVWHFGKSY